MTKLPFVPAALAAASSILLLSSSAPAQSSSDWPSYDITAHYLCDQCTDWQSATEFAQGYITAKHCDPDDVDWGRVEVHEDDGDSDGDSDGGGGDDGGGGSTPIDPDNGGGFIPFSNTSSTTAHCAGPDERANVLNPETGSIFTFIVERRSQARDGMPPLAYPRPAALDAFEKSELEFVLEQYIRYRDMRDELSEFMSSQAGSGGELGGYSCSANQDDGSDCPETTALAALSDPEAYGELIQLAIDWIADEYAGRFSDDTQVLISSGYFGVTAGPLSAGINVDVHNADSVEAFSHYFMFRNSDSGQELLDRMDALVFQFRAVRASSASGHREVFASVALDPYLSRINGRSGWLRNAWTSPEDLNECDFKQLMSAFRSGIIGNPGGGAGGASSS
ncbi:hypothetical protein [Natronospira bacteriovora]|uniref:Uncharacterized protein n=1 Tax=Natronospira bacteriovora TaxID=3069753 RepID=A0ABU0W798_9GAMM|nr:hypothetical protein [Natronospira sp. AB-CW4]MDQ2069628.1 hypothetical protein [Natronospira sp. AB-CW4]